MSVLGQTSDTRFGVRGTLFYYSVYIYMSHVARPLFSIFLWGGGKKGVVWFTVATRLGTFEVLIYRVIIDLGL